MRKIILTYINVSTNTHRIESLLRSVYVCMALNEIYCFNLFFARTVGGSETSSTVPSSPSSSSDDEGSNMTAPTVALTLPSFSQAAASNSLLTGLFGRYSRNDQQLIEWIMATVAALVVATPTKLYYDDYLKKKQKDERGTTCAIKNFDS